MIGSRGRDTACQNRLAAASSYKGVDAQCSEWVIILFAMGRKGNGDGGCCIFCTRNEVDGE
jgi:hypothetical protein